MVAELVTPLDRGIEPHRKPLRSEDRAKKRRTLFVIRIGRAHTPRDKFNAAVDYLRGMAKDSAVDREQAETALEHLTRVLIDAGDNLAKTIRRQR